jgi:hypothetical protein
MLVFDMKLQRSFISFLQMSMYGFVFLLKKMISFTDWKEQTTKQ